ncbi:MAG: hypothetical protein HYZ57_15530 [Acidobacteria bacterium]|nr:hypothetical protein [Acidobacteriota bacterium]MBI3281245.1 hypothetical protein [Acidobacteriota bacterium]
MLQVARLSPKQLGDSSRLVERFLHSRRNQDGGFSDRAGRSDLYYTVFGLESLIALRIDPPADVAGYLRGFSEGEDLDLVHLCCLVRCWAGLCAANPPLNAATIAAHIESHRSRDGGYHTAPGAEYGTAYGCFLALAAYQDLRHDLPYPGRMISCLRALRADDGGYANQRDLPLGLTPSTAAVVTLFRHLGEEVPAEVGPWLLARCRPDGGFFATPAAPVPDLLSTATALHALSGMKVPLDSVREGCLDFIDSLWTNQGSFYGNWTEDTLDCEYTWYGLLALGHLTL